MKSQRLVDFLSKYFPVMLLVFFLNTELSPSAANQLVADDNLRQTNSESVSEKDLLSGNWSGSWLSCKTGHQGKLKATFCRSGDSQVQAVFVGSFAKILPFRYRATLDIVHEEPGKIQLRGSQKLGPIMGTFSYEATITTDQFKATYRSKRDCGQWNMKKSECCFN